ncbi:hypothetical protein AX17_001122 [Amanita inopinata Kibby_2008]|nr:hypothetical protein AX17_001122 [Amanita inopinata Kibby_2008]
MQTFHSHAPVVTSCIIAQEEELDAQQPLRHLMHADLDVDGDGDSDESSPSKDYLSILPRQSHSVKDELLELTFKNAQNQETISVTMFMDASPGCGGMIWAAGQVLSSYIVKRGSEYLKDKVVVELGSGTGLVGLVAGRLGAKAWITDQSPLLDIMRRNVAMNKLDSSVTVTELNWSVSPLLLATSFNVQLASTYSRGAGLGHNLPRPDIILAADCVYYEPAFPLLVQTLADLADQSTEILFCYKKRRKADKRFFALLKKQFSWKDVTDDPDREIYNREAISLLRLYKTSRARVNEKMASEKTVHLNTPFHATTQSQGSRLGSPRA